MAPLSRNTKTAVVAVKKRQAKATQAQVDFMVDYFVQHPHVATRRFHTLHEKNNLTASWQTLVDKLNSMSKDNKIKDVKSWKCTWRDNKTQVLQKVTKLRESRNVTGTAADPPVVLSEREKKILHLMGYDYVEFAQLPDAFLEDQDCEDIPKVQREIPALTLRSSSDPVAYSDYEEAEDLEKAGVYETEPNSETVNWHEKQNPQSTAIKIETPDTDESGPSRIHVSRRQRRSSGVTRHNAKRLAIRLQDVREDFASLAQRQIECMEMFTKTMQQMAENGREIKEILRSFHEAQKARDKGFLEALAALKGCIIRRN